MRVLSRGVAPGPKVWALRTAALVVALLVPYGAAGREIGPSEDLCTVLGNLEAGEQLVLRAGDYLAGCVLRRPVVIRGADGVKRPRLVSPDHPVNMLEIRTNDVVIQGLEFWGGLHDADGVRVISGHRITVENCLFSQMGGIAIAATHTSVRDLTVRRNVILDSASTAMYFGCHEGTNCVLSNLRVEKNYIRGVTAPNPQIGYGLQVKLNSSGVIRDNIILDTKGPGIMVYGAWDLGATSVIERNVVRGSRTSSGIVVGGGPAIVRNNVSGWNFEAGIGLENYGHRNLLRGITVTHNSVYQNHQGGITVPDQGPVEASIVNNAAQAAPGTPALPAPRANLRMLGNVNCRGVGCFANPEGMDFSPFVGSLLIGSAGNGITDEMPRDDFFGMARGPAPSVGAIDRPSGPIHLETPH